MSDVLFPRTNSENSPIPDRPARAKRKRGVVGVEVGGSGPVSNTGIIELNIPIKEITPLSESMFNLQGVSESSPAYRFWRSPNGIDRDKWEMNYVNVLPLETANPSAAGIDWVHIVFKMCDSQLAIDDLDQALRDSLGFGIWEEQKMGRFNYSRQFLLEDGKSRFFIGGSFQRGTAMLAFPGSALQFMDIQIIRCLGENILRGWLTRVDFCVDFYNGEYSVDKAIKDYKLGLFHIKGKKPYHRFIGFVEGEVNTSGRTLYIGKRKSGKMLRVYEKGKKQGINKGHLSKWVRAELELHGSNPDTKNNRILPWDCLSRPGAYMAGGYKALEFVSETYDRIKAVAVKTACSMKKSVDHLRKISGKVVNALLHMGVNHYSIVEMIRGEGLPLYYNPKEFEAFEISAEEMREWCMKTFGSEQDYLLIPKL